jgi:tRNA nucleotidyltransferase (CCA-adding enzyme)
MINIPEEPNWIITKLMENGYDAYVVGGCVRDSILGNIPKDWDICTNAKPFQIKEVFKFSKIVDTGLKHGTVTIVLHNGNYEVTTYRIDGKYSDGRRPDSVSFTDSLKEDLSRRDFTINAMAYNNVIGLVDYFGGQKDLSRKEIKCVGNANDRFNEDALRIIRALRFSSVLGFKIEKETECSIFENYELLSKVSVERISSEFNKLICGKHLSVLQLYKNIISYIIPEIKDMFGFKQNNPYHCYDVWEHTILAIWNSPQDLEIRLALFFHDIAKPATYSVVEGVGHFYEHYIYSEKVCRKVLTRMKYDNKTIDNVCSLVYNHDIHLIDSMKSVRKVLNRAGDLFRKLVDVKIADMMAQSKLAIRIKKNSLFNVMSVYEKVLEEEQCFKLKDLAINGDDLIDVGYVGGRWFGKEIGITLNLLLDMVIDGCVYNDKEELLKIAKDRLDNIK